MTTERWSGLVSPMTDGRMKLLEEAAENQSSVESGAVLDLIEALKICRKALECIAAPLPADGAEGEAARFWALEALVQLDGKL